MSLINRMLRDLSTRTPPPGDVLGGVRLQPDIRQPGSRRTSAFLGLTAAITAALWLARGPTPTVPEVQAAAAPATAAPLAAVPAAVELRRFQLALQLATVPAEPPRRARARRAPPMAAARESGDSLEMAAAELRTIPMPGAATVTPVEPLTREERRRQARDALVKRDPLAAVRLLETDAPAVDTDPEYHGLLAAAYQRLDRHAEAAREYEALLLAQPDEAHWWAGLGLSRDALGDVPAALRAYMHARQIGRLEPSVMQHIESRAAALQQG